MQVHLVSLTWSSRRTLFAFLAIPVAIACVLVAWAPERARATTVVKLADEDLVRLSSIVVEGRVAGVYSEWNSQRTEIHTVVTINVGSAFKGHVPANGVLTLRMLGGRVDDVVMEIVGGPTFETGEDVILFLYGDGSELLPITGLFQGKLTVVTDVTAGLPLVFGRGVTRDAFVENVRRIVAVQEGER